MTNSQNVLSTEKEFDRVYMHLVALGLQPIMVKTFVMRLHRWVKCNGMEWTVERLKSLKPALIDYLTNEGRHYVIPLGWKIGRSALHGKIFKDKLVHYVFTRAKLSMSNGHIDRVPFNFLAISSVFSLEKTSSKQEAKMLRAVCSASIANPQAQQECIDSLVMRNYPGLAPKVQRQGSRAKPLVLMIGSRKRSPSIDFRGEYPTVRGTHERQDITAGDIWNMMFHDKATNQLWNNHPEQVSTAIVGLPTLPPTGTSDMVWDIPAGVITAIQEGGCKARWIANPLLLLQAFGEPLKLKLQSYSRLVYPEIYVDDQETGRERVAEWISEGKTVYCYDCTSFTDRFPLQLQRKALQLLKDLDIVSQFDLDSFELVMGKKWYYSGTGKLLEWRVGQPLGYGPSFALATLTHAALLDALDTQHTKLWMVVGDDVVIACPVLAEKYRIAMIGLGVEINQSKSVISSVMGEFLGKWILGVGVIPSTKVRPLKDIQQVIKLIEFYGKQSIALLSEEWWQAKLTAFAPREIGGLGVRPVGYSNAQYLGLFKEDKIANYLIESDIDETRYSDKWDSSMIQEWMQKKQVLLQPYHEHIRSEYATGMSLEHQGDKACKSNGLGGTSAPNHARTETPDAPHNGNTFVFLCDRAWFLCKEQPKSLRVHDRIHHLNRWGYVHTNCSPCTLQDEWNVNFSIKDPLYGRKCDDHIQYQQRTHLFYKRSSSQTARTISKGIEEDRTEDQHQSQSDTRKPHD